VHATVALCVVIVIMCLLFLVRPCQLHCAVHVDVAVAVSTFRPFLEDVKRLLLILLTYLLTYLLTPRRCAEISQSV